MARKYRRKIRQVVLYTGKAPMRMRSNRHSSVRLPGFVAESQPRRLRAGATGPRRSRTPQGDHPGGKKTSRPSAPRSVHTVGDPFGLARGGEEGTLNVLRTQLQDKFGPLPRWAGKRLDTAASSQRRISGRTESSEPSPSKKSSAANSSAAAVPSRARQQAAPNLLPTQSHERPKT